MKTVKMSSVSKRVAGVDSALAPPPSCGPGVPLIIDLMSYPVNNHLPSYSNIYVQRNGSDEEYFSLVELLRILVVFFSSLVQLVAHCS